MLIKFKKSAIKALDRMDKPTKKRIKESIIGLTLKPPQGDIKVMQGYSDTRFRLRVGQYRIIYKYDTDSSIEILLILDIGVRGDIYK
ncbi:type II toxin-antitoxin system RelE/ParE family toxin [Ruminococcus sp.]|uniref:type II toxin-antitoxin system RelE family toxin n=1 Tax=Ruminococcus sp. TaxID=41978 RepID=UPI0015B102F2